MTGDERVAEARATLDRAMSERELQDAVIELAQRLGWWCWHYPEAAQAVAARAGRWDALPERGLLDWLLVRDTSLLFVEFKAERGAVTLEQAAFIARLRRVQDAWGMPRCYVWRPADWSSGEIERVLREGH